MPASTVWMWPACPSRVILRERGSDAVPPPSGRSTWACSRVTHGFTALGGGWLVATDSCVSNIVAMPAHAQRELSASVVALDVYAFEFSLRSDTHWDASRRLVNWWAHQGSMSGRWAAVVPWDRQGNNNLTNTAYVLSFCRRYRIERPKRLRGADGTTAGGSGGVRRRVFDGDYEV